MTSRFTGDSMDPDRYTVEELREAALRGKGELSRPLALSLLGRKDYRQKTRDMSRLLMKEGETPRLRAMAATILGQSATPAAKRALQRGLEIEDDVALRGVIEGLSMAGGESEREALRVLSRRRGAIGTAVRAAGQLLEHRHGLRGSNVRVPEKQLRVSARLATEITVRSASVKRAGEAIAAVSQKAAALRLSAQGALTLKCLGKTLMFVPTTELAGGAERITRSKAEAGVVLARQELEGKGWEVQHHVLTEPERSGGARIVVTSPRGRVLYTGTASVRKDGSADFKLGAVDTPGVAAVDIRGTFRDGRVRIDRAKSDPRRRRRSPAPTELPGEG